MKIRGKYTVKQVSAAARGRVGHPLMCLCDRQILWPYAILVLDQVSEVGRAVDQGPLGHGSGSGDVAPSYRLRVRARSGRRPD